MRPRSLPNTPEVEKRRVTDRVSKSGREWARKRILALELQVADLQQAVRRLEGTPLRVVSVDASRILETHPDKIIVKC